MRRLFLVHLVFFLLFLLFTPLFLSHAQSVSLSGYKQNEEISGFQVTNQYLGPQNQVMGLRLTHQASGAIIHLLQMNTIPQAAISIRTYQKSNHGAAHALEHILLSRGKTGHSLNLLQNMVLYADGLILRQ